MITTMALTPEQKAARDTARSKQRYSEWKAEVDRLKLETGCEWPECSNAIDIPEQLEFAHLDQDSKDHKVTWFFKYSPYVEANRERARAEMAKCKVLCALHHRLETMQGNHAAYRRGNKAA